jgi:hypothetical protein
VTTTPLDQASVRASALARLLAHDARTPLNAIRGFAELMLAGAAGPLTGDALEHLAQIARAGRAIEDALRLTQELAELETAAPDAARAPVDLRSLLEEAGFAVEAGGARAPRWWCSAASRRGAGSAAPAGTTSPARPIRERAPRRSRSFARPGKGALNCACAAPTCEEATGRARLSWRVAAGQDGRLAPDEEDGVEVSWPLCRVRA